MGDHPGDGVGPYLWMVWDHPGNGVWCLTILGLVGDHPFENKWPSLRRLVTIFWMVDDHPGDGW